MFVHISEVEVNSKVFLIFNVCGYCRGFPIVSVLQRISYCLTSEIKKEEFLSVNGRLFQRISYCLTFEVIAEDFLLTSEIIVKHFLLLNV